MGKVAVLIDGGFYLKRLSYVLPDLDTRSAAGITTSIQTLVSGHLEKLASLQRSTIASSKTGDENGEFVLKPNQQELHYRTFFYDAPPFRMNTHRPISGNPIRYNTSPVYQAKMDLFDKLRKERNMALRLGETKGDANFPWQLRTDVLQDILSGNRTVASLTDRDFVVTIRQKGVDMRMGLDMSSIALKKQASTFVLVTGDADFIPAAKFVRREGCRVILDPMWQRIPTGLYEHIDGLDSVFPDPNDDN